jgi:hypothetical protein
MTGRCGGTGEGRRATQQSSTRRRVRWAALHGHGDDVAVLLYPTGPANHGHVAGPTPASPARPPDIPPTAVAAPVPASALRASNACPPYAAKHVRASLLAVEAQLIWNRSACRSAVSFAAPPAVSTLHRSPLFPPGLLFPPALSSLHRSFTPSTHPPRASPIRHISARHSPLWSSSCTCQPPSLSRAGIPQASSLISHLFRRASPSAIVSPWIAIRRPVLGTLPVAFPPPLSTSGSPEAALSISTPATFYRKYSRPRKRCDHT